MALMRVYKVLWSGGPGGPGISRFCMSGEGGSNDAGTTALAAFFQAVMPAVPSTYRVQCDGKPDFLEATTGELTFTGVGTVPAWTKQGGGTTAYAQGVGARVVWDTADIRHGRRVKGSTFIVPVITANYDVDGTLLTGFKGVLDTAATKLITDLGTANMSLTVWTRPNAKLGRSGAQNSVTTGAAPDKVSWLRTRRV